VVNQKVAVGLLEKLGHGVAIARNGREAVDMHGGASAATGFDLILMDVQMPEMDGMEATAAIRLREQGTGRRVPIVAMTAHAMKGDRERCLAAGMDGYLSKPIRLEELSGELERIAGTGPEAGAAAPRAGDEVAEDAISNDEHARTTHAAPPDGNSVHGAVVDWAVALETAGSSQELLRGIIDEFLAECPDLVQRLYGALETGDAEVFARLAHTIKSSTGYFGAVTAQDLAKQLEALGRGEQLAAAAELLDRLDGELRAVCQEMGAWRGRMSDKRSATLACV
jgi:CheY-like chemotaxis protein